MISNKLDWNKKKVFQLVLIFTIFGGFGFAVVNYFRAQYLLTIIETAVALISLGLLVYTHKLEKIVYLNNLKLVYIVSFFSIMMMAISKNGVSITIMSWVLIIPMISYLLLGVKVGFKLTIIFYGISAFIFFRNFSSHAVMTELVAYANILLCALVIWGVSHGYESASQAARKRLRKMAITDPLTGLLNRTTLKEHFDQTKKYALSHSQNVSFMLFDLDAFKLINDEFGHDVGDVVLMKFSDILLTIVKNNGYAFRIGGEEFAVMLTVQSELLVLSVAENIRRATERIKFTPMENDSKISVSVGVVSATADEARLSEMMASADRRMYQGKSQGRNIVIHKG